MTLPKVVEHKTHCREGDGGDVVMSFPQADDVLRTTTPISGSRISGLLTYNSFTELSSVSGR